MAKKKVGRPREFDPEWALSQAINVFWDKGYDGATLDDLTAAMGISRPSLYATFTDKHQLFLRAIDKYTTNHGCAPLVAFESEPDIERAVKAFMAATIEYATHQDGGQLGCFMGTCVAANALEVEGVQERLRQAIEETDACLAQRFDTEKAKGVLPKDFPSLERARLMFDLRQGHVLRARAGLRAHTMKADIQARVATILA